MVAVIAIVALFVAGLGASLLRSAPLLSLGAILGTICVFASVYRAVGIVD